jgi:hypothetical protein
VLTAVVIGTHVPIEFVYVLAAVVAGAGALLRPIQNALLPAFARTPRELVAANVASVVHVPSRYAAKAGDGGRAVPSESVRRRTATM